MNIKILYVKYQGDIAKERIVFKVLSKTDIGGYLVCDTTYHQDNSVSNMLRHTYWFPDKVVNMGDYIALYTKVGQAGEHENKSDTTTHTFYWGLDKTIWNKEGDGAVVFEIKDWSAKGIVPKE